MQGDEPRIEQYAKSKATRPDWTAIVRLADFSARLLPFSFSTILTTFNHIESWPVYA